MAEIEKLLQIMCQLRDPVHGCPWDREQTFASIASYTIEEAYEVAEAIAQKDLTELQDELGDLLFQVVFHAQMASEQGAFNFQDVVASIVDKMLRRHPHVFGDEQIDSAQQQTEAWERHKHEERAKKKPSKNEHASLLDGIPLALPALTRAIKLQKRAARVGFDWDSVNPIFDKITEEINEVKHEINHNAAHEKVEDEIGDLYFAVTNLARHLHVDPEAALRRSNSKFERRFKSIEYLAREQHKDLQHMSLDEMEALYQHTKSMEE